MNGRRWGAIRPVSVLLAVAVTGVVADVGPARTTMAHFGPPPVVVVATAEPPAAILPAARPVPPASTAAPPVDAAPADPAAPATQVAPFRITPFSIRRLAPDQLPYADTRVPSTGPPKLHDRQGLPLKRVGKRTYYGPAGLAQYGLRHEDAYRRVRGPQHLAIATATLDKLMDLAVNSNGAAYIPYAFDFAMHGNRREMMRAPWYSAMAQGLALSLAIRLHRDTGDAQFRDDADRLFASIKHLGRGAGPWVTYVDEAGYLWLEEYAQSKTPSDHAANGFNFALFGVYDYYLATDDPSALRILQASLTTMRDHMDAYRVPGKISLYCLRHGRPQLKYHRILIWQLEYLAAISGDPAFARMSQTLTADHA